MAIESFRRVEKLPVREQQLAHFLEKVDRASQSATDQVVLFVENFSFPRLKEVVGHWLSKQKKITQVHISALEGEWSIDAEGKWSCSEMNKWEVLGQSNGLHRLDLFSTPQGLYAEKTSVLKQLYLGIIPFIKDYKNKKGKVEGFGRIDLGELKTEDLKEVISLLKAKGVKLELLPYCSHVRRHRDGSFSLKVVRELIFPLVSVNPSRFEGEISKRKFSLFRAPEPISSTLKLEDCYLNIRDELQFVAQSSPLVRKSQHDIPGLDRKYEDKLLKNLDRQGYAAEIDGPYVKSDIFGRCTLCTTLTIDLPDSSQM